uniref:Uncharacterized protein n=1 Tax=Anguilla anguilla TaxID=7936 RepID=A0A0E9R8D9_ANGAN
MIRYNEPKAPSAKSTSMCCQTQSR